MSHVTHRNESCHACRNESCHTEAWVISHIGTSHGTTSHGIVLAQLVCWQSVVAMSMMPHQLWLCWQCVAAIALVDVASQCSNSGTLTLLWHIVDTTHSYARYLLWHIGNVAIVDVAMSMCHSNFNDATSTIATLPKELLHQLLHCQWLRWQCNAIIGNVAIVLAM